MSMISVVIPTFNSSFYLPHALNSVFNQTHQNIEVIVVDDGSTDDTGSIIRPYAERVIYIVKRNAGSASARNLGIKHAQGEWIAFLDSDDCWTPCHLEWLDEARRLNPEVDLVYCGKQWVDCSGLPLLDAPVQEDFPAGWIFAKLFLNNYISSASCVYAKRSRLVQLGGFNEGAQLRNCQDYDLWLRIAANSQISSVPKYSVLYRRHENNVTLNTVNSIRGLLAALNNAAEMVLNKKVHPCNCPQLVNVNRRMKEVYTIAARSLLYKREYVALRQLSLEAIVRRHITMSMLFFCCFGYLPSKWLDYMRDSYSNFRVNVMERFKTNLVD